MSFDGRGLEAVAGDRDQGRRRGYGLEWTLLFLLALANGAVALHQYVPITVPRLVDAWVQLGSAGARSVIAAPGSSGADVDAVTWPDGLSVGFSMRGTRTKPVVRLVNAQTGVEVDQSPEVYDSSKGLALDTAFERWRGRGRPDGEYELFVKLQGEPPTEFLLLKLRRADNRGLLPLAKGDGGLLRVKDDAEVFPIVGPNSRPLLFDRAEVSWAQWYRYLKSTKADALAPVPHGAEPAHPVTNVTLAEASFYCRWVGGRLPERAEWQAAVGKDAWPWGREWDGLAPTLDRSSPVEIAADENWDKRPEEGIIDLTGNVAEWVIEAEPTAMGGSYLDPAERWERMPGLRSDAGRPVTRERSPAVGFRCVMDTED